MIVYNYTVCAPVCQLSYIYKVCIVKPANVNNVTNGGITHSCTPCYKCRFVRYTQIQI